MTVRDIAQLLEAKVVVGEQNIDKEVHSACGSDMMSDVLAFVKDQAVLLTGLCNVQSIRTAGMLDMVCVVLVRGKQPDQAMTELADKLNIVLLTCDKRMYLACGILFANGLGAGEITL